MNSLKAKGLLALLLLLLLFCVNGCDNTESPPLDDPLPSPDISALIPTQSSQTSQSTPLPSNSSAISLVVRNYDAFLPIIMANGGHNTSRDSLYANSSLNINIEQDKEKSIVDVFESGTEIVGTSIVEYALSISDLKNANIETSICYSVSSEQTDCVILVKQAKDSFVSGKDVIAGVKGSVSLYEFLLKSHNLSKLYDFEKEFFGGLKHSVKQYPHINDAFKAFSEDEDIGFLVMSKNEYEAVSTEADEKGYRLYIGNYIPDDTVNVLVFKPGTVNNDIISIIEGSFSSLYKDDLYREGFDFVFGSKVKSVEWLKNNNTAEEIVFSILDIKAAVTDMQNSKSTVSPGDFINTTMLEIAHPPLDLIRVGNYVSLHIDQIPIEAKENFNFIAIEQTSHLPVGEIINQDPVAGVYRKSGSDIILTVSNGVTLVRVPDLIGMSRTDAEEILTGLNLKVGAVFESISSDVNAGLVVSQEPSAGEMKPEHFPVEITVSVDEIPPLLVPDLYGLTVEEARSALHSIGLILKINEDYEPVNDAKLNDKVVIQQPSKDTPVEIGDFVTVTQGTTYTIFPIDVKFKPGVFSARGIMSIKDMQGNELSGAQLADRIAKYVEARGEGRSIKIRGFVSSKYQNPTPGIVLENEVLARKRATAIREIIQNESDYLKGVTIIVEGENRPSGIEGTYNYEDCRALIMFE